MSLPKCFLEEKTAIVTGASAGIGRAVSHALANAGVNVVLAARDAQRLSAVRDNLIEQTGVKVIAVPTDVTSIEQLRRLVDTAADEFGAVHILVNNAGIDAFQPLHSMTPLEIARLVETNLTAAIQLTSLTIPHMLTAGWGHIVNMASTAGKYGPPFGGVYGASKAGLIALTQSLRLEYRTLGLRATAICPGFAASGGIYDRIREKVGIDPPRVIGGTNAETVARAVVRAIRKDQPEVIVNRPPQRPFFVAATMFPSLGEYLFRKLGLRYFKRLGRAAETAAEPVVHHQDAA
ncbi:MAG: SDR family NAD(P)-dependent oxidoreductase [Planctomycetaceae bacterium]